MSELSELIKINKKIVEQNEEIIRLLKVIADEPEYVIMGETGIIEAKDVDLSVKVGEVISIEDSTIFKVFIKDGDACVVNLLGAGEAGDFHIQEFIARQSLEINKPIDEGVVILGNEVKGKLPETLKTCVESNVKKAFLPWDIMKELVYAPYDLQSMIKLDFYKTKDDLASKLF